MITDADIEKLKQVFPTRDDLKDFARKDDLKGFATKDDLNRFATKDDLNDFARKDDLKEMEKRMTKTIVKAIMEVYEILEKHDQELEPLKYEQRGQRIAIGDHETRIKHLEYPTL